MMRKIYFSFLVMVTAIISNNSSAQTNIFPSNGSAGIGTTSPNASSLFEIKSTTKGILIPRMTSAQRDAIASPATALMIYQTNSSPGFYYYDGGKWIAVSSTGANNFLSNLTAPTSVNVDLLPDNNATHNIGSSTNSWKNIYSRGAYYLDGKKIIDNPGTSNLFVGNTGNTINSGAYNLFIGESAGLNNTAGQGNCFIGFSAGNKNTASNYNSFVGFDAGYNNSGAYNSFFGALCGNANTTGSSNSFFGSQSGYVNTTGVNNSFFGEGTGGSNTTGSNNSFIGTATGVYNTTGYSNVAVGANALFHNSVGHNLVAVGDSALYNQQVNSIGFYYNTALGSKTLFSNTTGVFNTAAGYQALYSNTTGTSNTAVGYFALQISNGDFNTGIGHGALSSNTIGQDNAALGADALQSNTDGYANTASGDYSLRQNTSGAYNTAAGYEAGYHVTTGILNTFLGTYADCSGQGQLTNSTAIGNGASVLGDNKVVIGNSSVTSIGGYAGWTNFSDGRYKQNIKQNVPGLAFINKLKPITYTLNINAIESKLHEGKKEVKTSDSKSLPNTMNDAIMEQAMTGKSKIIYTGFVAQDVEKAAKDLNYDFSGVDKPQDANQSFYGLRYSDFVVPLVKAVQELSSQNDSLNLKMSQFENLKMENEELKSRLNVIEQKLGISSNSTSVNITLSSASLQQNIPNPFNSTTTINYSLPKQFSSAKIIVTDNTGKVLKEINVSGTGKNSVQINASTLSSGAYQYSLYVDGKIIDTKKMMLTK